MSSTPYLYLYTTPQDPPNWRLATKIYQAIGQTLEYLLERAEDTTGITILSILALSIWKQEMRIIPVIGIVGVCFHEWVLVFALVIQVSVITLAMAGFVNFVLWKLFLKDFWVQVCHGRRAANLFLREAPDQVFGALAGWYGWCDIALVMTRPLEWAENVRHWIAYFRELPGIYWKKVSESRILAWAHTLISYLSPKRHEVEEDDEVVEEDGKGDPETTTYIAEPAAAPTTPRAVRSIHCTGSTSTDYVNPRTSAPPNQDLLLPESYPLPAAVVPYTPTAQQLREQDPFKTPMPPRAGDPDFLNAYPSPEGGSKWQRGEKSLAEMEREKWKTARTLGSMASGVPKRNLKPSPGSEPGFLDAYPNPLQMPRKWSKGGSNGNVEPEGNFRSDDEVGSSSNSGEGNELHKNRSKQLAITEVDGESAAESSAGAGRDEEGSETASCEDSQENLELYARNRFIQLAVSAVDGSGIELHYQSYFAQLHIVDANRLDAMASPVAQTPPQPLAGAQAHNIDTPATRATRPAEGDPEGYESRPGLKRIRY